MSQSALVIQTKMLDLYLLCAPATRSHSNRSSTGRRALSTVPLPASRPATDRSRSAPWSTRRRRPGGRVRRALTRIILSASAGSRRSSGSATPQVRPQRPACSTRGSRPGVRHRRRRPPRQITVERRAAGCSRRRRRRAHPPGEGAPAARLRVRHRRRRRRLRKLHDDRCAAAVNHQDRSRDRARDRHAGGEAGARRGVRLVRPANRRPAHRRGISAAGDAGQPQAYGQATSGRPTEPLPPRSLELRRGRAAGSVAGPVPADRARGSCPPLSARWTARPPRPP